MQYYEDMRQWQLLQFEGLSVNPLREANPNLVVNMNFVALFVTASILAGIPSLLRRNIDICTRQRCRLVLIYTYVSAFVVLSCLKSQKTFSLAPRFT